MDYHRANRVNIRIARIFNTYGPRMHPFDGRVVSNFIRQALRGEDITIFGDGSQPARSAIATTWSTGLIRLMDGPDDLPGPVNLGNPEEFTIRQLAELVLELTGAARSWSIEPLPADDPAQRRPGHHAGHRATGLAADGAVARGAGADDRLVPLDRHGALPPADAAVLGERGKWSVVGG